MVYLAIDIGASSGRHIAGRLDGGRLVLEEIHRFPNGVTDCGGTLLWDTDALFSEIEKGIETCAALGMTPKSLAIDTWGVDFVLLGADGKPLGGAVAYRDSRTAGMDAEVEKILPYAEHYARTGIQKQPFNTVYQLMALKLRSPELLDGADCLLLTPDYFHYKLSGEKRAEYTIASTTGLINAAARDWDWEIIDRLGFPRRVFPPVKHGLPPSHDTASAFLAVPAGDGDSVCISSGTWSLLGVVSGAPILTQAARDAGFSNEGGFGGTIRFLKNIMGLWMIQSVRGELPGKPSYAELSGLARASAYDGLVDVNDAAFFAPESMIAAIRQKCAEAGYPPPVTAGDVSRCVYTGLAREYARSVRELETLTGKRYTAIHIIGGGSQDGFLNELTAQASGLPVYAGPAEGTALGNILSQMLRSGELPDLKTARELIKSSFSVRETLA
ncbi:MAG: rhamnulokinase [Oscillospiraceae bacterium]|nr:rhamnulokinase [Oscillospiraceae bacterium]